jgi:hypothetical protein
MSKVTIVIEFEPTSKTANWLATEHRLGWQLYANGEPATECSTLTMIAGWLQALRDQANADASAFIESVVSDPALAQWQADGSPRCGSTWAGDYSSVYPAEQRYGYIGE